MTDQLSPQAIAYIVEWAARGNEPRDYVDVPESVRHGLWLICLEDFGTVKLDPAGLTIAALASENARLREALEQACEVAEDCQSACDGYLREKYDVDEQLETMRDNNVPFA